MPNSNSLLDFNRLRYFGFPKTEIIKERWPVFVDHNPSAIIRRVVEEGGKVKIKTKGHTSADQKLFGNWLINFGQADWQIKKDFNLKH